MSTGIPMYILHAHEAKKSQTIIVLSLTPKSIQPEWEIEREEVNEIDTMIGEEGKIRDYRKTFPYRRS